MISGRRRTIVVFVGLTVGSVLFLYAVGRVGVDALTDGVRRVGWGLVAILGLGGARFVVRAQCWRWCLPPGVIFDFPHAFSAFVAGDAVGNVTPLGLLASEPTKVLLVRHHLATLDSVASLTLENILYGMSVAAMLAFGAALFLTTTTMPDGAWWIAAGALAGAAVVVASAVALLRAPRLLRVRSDVWSFAAANPGRLARVLALQIFFHVLAVVETFLTLRWLLGGEGPTFVQAVVFETVNRFTAVAFKFVPFRIGVDEAASAAIAPLVAATAGAGVTLAVIRKVRVLFWSAVGLSLIATHPARSRSRGSRDDGKP